MKNNLKGSLQDLKKLSKQLSKERAQQKKTTEAALQKKQGLKTAVSDEDRKIFLASIRGTKPLADSNRIEAGAAQSTTRETEFFKQKRAQAEGKDLLTQQRRRSVADTTASSALPAHAQAVTRAQHARTAQIFAQLDEGVFLRHADGADVIKKLQRGQWPVEASLDLHGSNLEKAAERFDRFMHTCIEHNIRCVCVIHGQGYGSKDNKPVLKDAVQSWLRDLSAVTAYIPAPESIGGAGALVILLKSR
ncbi:MAG: Smr/MutS family protein [Alcaligenaceae bacterium]|nr:Smr/MutS family protein [Alcaligenaceae bacterium]